MNNLLNIKTPAEAVAQTRKADYNLSNLGVMNLRLAYWNLAMEALYEEAVFRGEGITSVGGPFVAHTGKHTGRSANDKFVVKHVDSENHVWWGVCTEATGADDKVKHYIITSGVAVAHYIYAGREDHNFYERAEWQAATHENRPRIVFSKLLNGYINKNENAKILHEV